MKVDLQLTGMNDVLDMLKKLPAEVVSKNGGPVKSALRKGANVILKQAKANLQASIATDPESESTGLLLQNMVVTRGKAPTNGKGERYLVRVRRKGYGRAGVSTLKTANIKEYGSSKQPAAPFIRPAFQSKAKDAIRTTEVELVKAIDRVVKKLAK